MSHLWTSVRIDALNRQSHDAPRDYHLGRSKAPGIEHQRARCLFAQTASKRLCRQLRQKRVLIA